MYCVNMYILCSHVSIVSCSICVFFLFRTYFYYAIFINNNLCSNSCVFYVYITLNDHTKHFFFLLLCMYQPLLLFLITTLILNCDTDSLFLSPSIIHRHPKNILHCITAYVMLKSFMLYLSQKSL